MPQELLCHESSIGGLCLAMSDSTLLMNVSRSRVVCFGIGGLCLAMSDSTLLMNVSRSRVVWNQT